MDRYLYLYGQILEYMDRYLPSFGSIWKQAVRWGDGVGSGDTSAEMQCQNFMGGFLNVTMEKIILNQ